MSGPLAVSLTKPLHHVRRLQGLLFIFAFHLFSIDIKPSFCLASSRTQGQLLASSYSWASQPHPFYFGSSLRCDGADAPSATSMTQRYQLLSQRLDSTAPRWMMMTTTSTLGAVVVILTATTGLAQCLGDRALAWPWLPFRAPLSVELG